MKKLRFRNVALIGGSICLLAYFGATHPGALTWQEHILMSLAFFAKLATPVIAVLFTYGARKALFDYIDLYTVFKKAMESAVGAGLVFLGACILMFGLLGLFGTQVNAQPVTTYVPEQAKIYMPQLKVELAEHWNDHPKATCSVASSSKSLALV